MTALREWLLVFVNYLDAKYGMAEVLNSLAGGASALYAESGARMKEAIAKLTDDAVASGDILMDMEPLDLLRALAGVMNREPGPDSKRAARRLVDILIAGVLEAEVAAAESLHLTVKRYAAARARAAVCSKVRRSIGMGFSLCILKTSPAIFYQHADDR